MPQARDLKVLVVDDQQVMRGLARQCLKRMGVVNVALAASGDAAFEQMQSEKFDAVISDLNMPGISGVDLAKQIKAHPVLKGIPVLLATSEMFRDKIEDGVADHFVAKPFSVADLKTALEASLGALS